jgi:hypothetical protein
MYTLHGAALNSEDIQRRSDSTQTIKITLDTVTRMVIDIAHAFNAQAAEGVCNVEALSPTIAHIVRCAQQHIFMCKDPRNEQWARDFDGLRQMLRFFSQRWLSAGKSETIMKAQPLTEFPQLMNFER